jgi:hypothetical protein
MKLRALVAGLAAFAVVGLAYAADIKSGPQPGESVTPFHPYNVFNSENADMCGKDNCIVCQYGAKPVALVFARKPSPAVASLVKKMDAEVAKAGQEKMGAAVIFLSAEDNIKQSVAQMQEKSGVKNVCLAVDGPKGPEKYKIAPEAEVTVILYKKHQVQANHAFEAFDVKSVEKIAAELPKILEN